MQRLCNFLDLDEFLLFCIQSLLQPKDNEKPDEASSLHAMI